MIAQNPLVIRGGTIVNVRDGSIVPDTVIVVEGDKIVSISSGGGQVPSGGTVIDATNKYILPGLIDCHTHYKEWAPELYLNHGVTTIVDLGNSLEWIKAQKDGVNSGLIPGPRIFHGTNLFETPPPNQAYFMRPHTDAVRNPEEALASMKQYVAGKVDVVKVGDGLSIETLRIIMREAQKANLPVIAQFFDPQRDLHLAADVGVNGIQHTMAVAHALLDRNAQAEALKKVRKGFVPPVDSFMDAKNMAAIVRLMVTKGFYFNPTMRMDWQGDRALREKGFQYQDFDLILNDWRLRYVPLNWKLADMKEYQNVKMWHWADLTQYEQDLFHQGYTNVQHLVKMFADAGGKLYAGTDSSNMAVPGLATHQELELLVGAGIKPLQALQAATINPAKLMRVQDRLGTIDAGKAADILILDQNPLEDIRNTRTIARVISRGRVLDGQYHGDFENPIPKSQWEDSSHFFPSPRIRWASPEAIVEGDQSATLIVKGTGFVPYSFIRFGRHVLNTKFIDAFQLTAGLPAKFLERGTYAVTVENPDFTWETTFASGATDLIHLGVRDRVSNEYLVIVKPKGGAPIFPHPRELSENK